MKPLAWLVLAVVVVALVSLVGLRAVAEPVTVEGMPTLAVKKPTAKRSRAGRKLSTASLRAVDENGRFILGYASHVVSVRPGVDLTKPTLPPGKYFV